MKGLLRRITDSGGSYAGSKSEKRNIILSNYVSLVGCAALLLLLAALVSFYGFQWGMATRLIGGAVFFLVPLGLNRSGLVVFSRVLLCAFIPLLVFGISILDLKAGEIMSAVSFVGLRLFLLVSLCFPFLLFDLRQKWLLALGLSFTLVSILFFDAIFALFDVAYTPNGGEDLFYEFSNVRALIAAFAIASSLFFMKLVMENAERLNHHLLGRLEEQNNLIKRHAEAEVYKSEARFRGAFEHSAIGMALVSVAGEWLKVNPELCHMVGYSEQELLRLTVQEITHPDDTLRDNDLQQQLVNGCLDSYQRERRYMHRNGSVVWVNLNVSLVKDSQGSPLYFVAQIEDITTEKEAREKLILNEANIEAMINNTGLLIWSVDLDFRLVIFNNQFANHMVKYYGIHVQIGSKIFSAQETAESRGMTEKWTALYHRALGGERVTVEENRFGIDFHYSLSPIVEAGAVIGISIFADDITERKTRERELAEANRKIGELKLMALRSVMSPHFTFNVLNSIQFFIAKNDRLNAINYLSMFSKLVRSVLTHSVTNRISLSQEIEMLRTYVELEMTRFENRFSYSITMDDDLKLEEESIAIPSLLVQPYVENAILHGLYNKKENGELVILITEQAGMIFFEIRDNGIGRAAARELRKKSTLKHLSMGISITEERLKLINQDHHAAFEIEDLMEGDIPLGTRVRIGIPYETHVG